MPVPVPVAKSWQQDFELNKKQKQAISKLFLFLIGFYYLAKKACGGQRKISHERPFLKSDLSRLDNHSSVDRKLKEQS